jgi:hypothetical protein
MRNLLTPAGKLLIALVLPFRPHVESGRAFKQTTPSEHIMQGQHTFEEGVERFVEEVRAHYFARMLLLTTINTSVCIMSSRQVEVVFYMVICVPDFGLIYLVGVTPPSIPSSINQSSAILVPRRPTYSVLHPSRRAFRGFLRP